MKQDAIFPINLLKMSHLSTDICSFGIIFTFLFKTFSSNSQMKQAAIFPGTNWCGKGTIANEYSKLGSFGGADKCCRQHDLGCPAYIKSGNEDYGLYNYKLWTLNHCTCDER